MFTPRLGARPGVKKSLVVFINDKVQSDSDALALLGKTFRDSSINVIVIGLDPDVENEKLQALSPSQDIFFFPPLLDEIDMLLYPVVRAAYPGKCCLIFPYSFIFIHSLTVG